MSTVLTRRMLRIHAMALAAVAVCVLAAQWQWHRAHVGRPSSGVSVEFAVASPLREFLPVASIGKQTSVSGVWLPGFRLTVPRASAYGPDVLSGKVTGDDCPWVVDAVRLADDSLLAVVRGCGTAPVPAAQGAAAVQGVLQPSEDSDLIGFTRNAITTTDLAARLRATVHDGYLVEATAVSGLQAVTPLLPQQVAVPLHWRNVVYVGNWLVFAAIVLVMWRRVVQDEMQSEQIQEDERVG